MMIVRLILINSILMLLMLGNQQAANNTMAVATNFPMPGKGIAALFRQKNRHDTILSFGASGEPFGQINKPCHFSCFFRPTAFTGANLTRTASRFPNAASSMRQTGSCCGDRVPNSQIARRRSRCHSVDSRLVVA